MRNIMPPKKPARSVTNPDGGRRREVHLRRTVNAKENDPREEEEAQTTPSRPQDVAKFVLDQERENKALKAEVKRLKRDNERKEECILAFASTLKDEIRRSREKDIFMRKASNGVSSAIRNMVAVEHVVQNAMDFVEVASSALSLPPDDEDEEEEEDEVQSDKKTTPDYEEDEKDDEEEEEEEDEVQLDKKTTPDYEEDEVPSEPVVEEASNPIDVVAQSTVTGNSDPTPIAFVSTSEFFEEEEAVPSHFTDENGRPLGSTRSLPIATAVGDHELITDVVNSVITSLDDASRDIEELTPVPTRVNHAQHLPSGTIGGPLPSFQDVIHTLPHKHPSISYLGEFGAFLMANGGVCHDVGCGVNEQHVFDSVATEEVVLEEGCEEPEDGGQDLDGSGVPLVNADLDR